MRTLILTLACFFAGTVQASLYHGIFSGTVGNVSAFAPVSNGDAFTLMFELDVAPTSATTATVTPLFTGLNIAGVTGTFGNAVFSASESGIFDNFDINSLFVRH